MNREFLLAALIVLTVALSVSTIYASDVNTTDSYAASLDDANSVSVYNSNVDNDSSNDNILKSENSDTLSTNTGSNSLSESDDNAKLAASNTKIAKSKTITSEDITKYYKGSAQYKATFYDIYGNVLKNTDVQLTINGKTYTQKTNSKGVASLAIGLYPNTYKMTAVNPQTGYSLTNTIKVLSTIKSSDLTKVYSDSKKFTATFLDNEGKALANKEITFKINGRPYTQKTDSNGVASLAIGLYKGTYTMTSTNVDGLSSTNTIKVLGSTTTKLTASDYTFLTTDTKTIKVKLINGLGYALDSGKTVTFKVNGKTYTANTNSNGVASLKLPNLSAGTYTVTYSFAGNSYYGASSTTSKVSIVSNSKTPTLTVKSTTTFGRGANTPLEVALTVDGVPLAGKTVTFTVNGRPYDKITDSNGIASLPIGLAVGKYTISYANKADSNLNSKSGSIKITVVERNKTTLTWKSSTSFTSGANTFKVLLKDSINPISGATINLVVNSKEYSAKTSSTGYAKFNITLSKAGDYPVSFSFKGDNLNAPSSGSKTITITSTSTKSISIKDIVSGATTLKNYYANNGKLPSSVTAGGVKFTVPEFLYLMTQATYQLGNSNTKAITYITGIAAPSSISGDAINSQLLYKKDYLTVSKTIADDMKTDKKAPNYASTTLGKINYNALVDSFARIVAFYGSNDNTLPNYVTINAKAITPQQQEPTGKTISISDIVSGATTLKNYYANNGKLPSSVTAGGVKFTVPEFLYLMTQATYQLGNSNTKAITYITGIAAPSSISGDEINSNLYMNDYLDLAQTVANYLKTNKKAPNYATTNLGKINYTELVDAFSRIVAFYGSNGNTLPAYVTIKSSSESITPPVTGTGSGLNEKNTVTDLTPYLKSSTNCPVNNTEIKALVDSLTSGLTSDYDKAQALFNYVRDAITYSFYYDTRYGAVGTLHAKAGNCVDHSHLLISMFRTAGLASRYVQGSNCHFTSGTYGHVWTQVLIDGNWIVADATSARNSFGKIVNWNTNSFNLIGIYSGISF